MTIPGNITAVMGTVRWIQAARGQLVRLVVVTAVLAGLGLPLGLQCAHAMPVSMPMSMPMSMAAAMPMAHGAASADAEECLLPGAMTAGHDHGRIEPADTGLSIPACAAAGIPAAFAHADDDSSSSNGMDGLLATCLMLIAAVMAAVARLHPAGIRGIVRVLRSVLGVVMFRAVRPRAPSLAELCLLRT